MKRVKNSLVDESSEKKDVMVDLETIINKIRDILRTEGITGMDSINHCILFLLCRSLDAEMCERFNIPESFAFENIMKDENGNELDNSEFYEKFYRKNSMIDSFVKYVIVNIGFDNIRGNFKMVNIRNIKKIITMLGDYDLHHKNTNITEDYDIIGTIYEIHLKSGTSNAMRDLGQYFTNRKVIEYMIKLCDPAMIKSKIETIVDPTMGTGGFLTMAIKYLNTKYKNKIDWSKNKDNVYGFDIDGNVRNMAVVNCLLETGQMMTDTLLKEDTLRYNMMMPGKKLDKAKIILANEPMGLKNIAYDDCCDKIKELNIKGTKAEPLFLQLFMQMLDDGGRCAVVVPDGVLFNESKLHKDTRKHLIENFNLQKVINLDGDFFLNTGVKTSILFFSNDGKTNEVDFCQISLDNGSIKETSIVKASYNDITEKNYNLFVNKYKQSEVEKYENVQYLKLKDICQFSPKSKKNASFGSDEGEYPFYTSSKIVKRCDECDYDTESIILGTGGSANIKYDTHFSCSADNIIMTSEEQHIKYIYYYLLININILEEGFTGSTIKHISKQYIENLQIPVPSIELQKKIVERLDLISDTNKTMINLIDNLKEITRHYVETLTSNSDKNSLSTFCDSIKTGKNKPSDNKKGTKYPYYGTGGITGYTDEYLFDGTYLLTPRNGSIGNVIKITGKFFPSDHIFVIDCGDNIDFIHYYLQNSDSLESQKHGATIPGITKKTIEDTLIPVISVEKQKKIIEYCDNITNVIKNNEYIIKKNKKLMKQLFDRYIAKHEEKITTKVVRENISLKANKPIKKASNEEDVKVSTSKKTAKVRKL